MRDRIHVFNSHKVCRTFLSRQCIVQWTDVTFWEDRWIGLAWDWKLLKLAGEKTKRRETEHAKWSTSYSGQTMRWLRCRLSFSLLRSSIQCIREARSNHGHAIHLKSSIELTVSESVIPLSSWTHAIHYRTRSHSLNSQHMFKYNMYTVLLLHILNYIPDRMRVS